MYKKDANSILFVYLLSLKNKNILFVFVWKSFV